MLKCDWLQEVVFVDNNLLRILRDHVSPETDEYFIGFFLIAFVSNRYSWYCFLNQISTEKSRQNDTQFTRSFVDYYSLFKQAMYVDGY